MPPTLNIVHTVSASDDIATTLGSGSVGGSISGSLSMSPPTMDATYAETLALVAGTLTIDLTALPRGGQSALDLTGERVFGYCVKNLGANEMVFIAAATTGYALFSATGGTKVLPGGVASNHGADGFGTVAAGAKDITITGTAAQTFQIILYGGPPAA